MKDLMKMMKQAQEIQGRMQKMQEELAALEVEGQSGARPRQGHAQRQDGGARRSRSIRA